MISVNVRIIDREVLVRLDRLPARIHAAVQLKFSELVGLLREKVAENLGGKVLQIKSGALLRSLGPPVVENIGLTLIGTVDIIPENENVKEYALAHEYGGKGSYEIVPMNKSLLRFIGKSGDVVFAPYVYHPAAAERSYLRSALADMQPIFTSGIEDAVFDGLYNE